MTGRTSMVCVSCVAFLVAGCTLDSAFLVLNPTSAATPDHVFPGKVSVAAKVSQDTLQRMGVMVLLHENAAGVRITGHTKAGHAFEMLFSQHADTKGESTSITIVWEREPEMRFWIDFLAALAVHEHRNA